MNSIMKKIITIFAAISFLAVSCQKEDIINDEAGITTGKLTATMAGRTKGCYYETEDGPDDWDWSGLQPEWEEGDEIIGFDDAGNTYTLTVEDVSEDGVATLSGTVPDGNLHLIYKYGAQASDISNKTLTVDVLHVERIHMLWKNSIGTITNFYKVQNTVTGF